MSKTAVICCLKERANQGNTTVINKWRNDAHFYIATYLKNTILALRICRLMMHIASSNLGEGKF